MGSYINPPDQSKEEFLRDNGVMLGEGRGDEYVPHWPPCDGNHFVCLVDNGMFTAAGIVLNEGDLASWSRPNDLRYKLWWEVPTDKLLEVSDLKYYLSE